MASAAAEVGSGIGLGAERVLFVGGKGGVGKTTVASAIALRIAERGERCLLVSTDPAHSLGDLWGRPLADEERELAPGIVGIEIDPERQVDRHLDTVRATIRDMVRPQLHAEVDRQMALARLSPGAVEAALLERMAELMLAGDRFDRIVFDTAPTGHTLRLLSLPEIMAAWTEGLLRQRDRSDALNRALKETAPRTDVRGEPVEAPAAGEGRDGGQDERSDRIRRVLVERRDKFHRARQLLLNPGACGFLLVLVPEKLPILESRKALDALAQHEMPVLAMIVNRVLPNEPLGSFLERRRDREAAYMADIDRLFPKLRRVTVPLLPNDVDSVDSLRAVADRLLPSTR